MKPTNRTHQRCSQGTQGHPDATVVLIMARHGLRVSEAIDLEWDQIDFSRAHIHIRRLKGGIASVHPLQGDELRALRGVAQANRRPLYILQRTRRADDQIEREQDTRGRCPKSRLALSASAHAPPYLRASSSGCWSRHTTALAMAGPCGHQTHCALLGAECEAV